ncbi:MAG TPA: thiamine pyrophosphate-binding protein [Streptosporangiaceae bacterium]|nr:thiamine pyrophosphate-binding protein [Streptosporangiaceae bacterium]
MLVTDAVAKALSLLGADTVFGVVGSGNFHVTNALIANGARFIAARHECGAASMADAWARLSGRPGILSVHQGPGLTNALTGITEAAKARTPLLVLAADVSSQAVTSNFRIDVGAIAAATGATPARLGSASLAIDDAVRAYRLARDDRRTVVLAMPLDVQAGQCTWPGPPEPGGAVPRPPSDRHAAELAAALATAARPVFIAGRGARTAEARSALERLADGCGALLATSAAAKGLFRGSPWDLDVSGGFASPLAAELITGADLIVAWGSSLNMWTTRHGRLIGPDTRVIQVDCDAGAIGRHRRAHHGVVGDVALTARSVTALLEHEPREPLPPDGGTDDVIGPGYRSAGLRKRLATEVRWRDVPFEDESDGDRIDPRALTIALDDMLPAERIVAVDSGNFMGYPSMFMSVPDHDGFCFTQAYQSIGLGLASAIGSAIARPDRLTVAALGDGGALMGISELETAVRLSLPMVIAVYDDEAYGAEVHHFGPDGFPLDTVRFPAADIAAIARGFGCDAVTVRSTADLGPVRDWLESRTGRPMVIDAKVTSAHGSWWLEEAFRGH